MPNHHPLAPCARPWEAMRDVQSALPLAFEAIRAPSPPENAPVEFAMHLGEVTCAACRHWLMRRPRLWTAARAAELQLLGSLATSVDDLLAEQAFVEAMREASVPRRQQVAELVGWWRGRSRRARPD